jgi:hypothetical protein
MTDVEFPAMRREVVGALASLADPEYQRRAWVDQHFETPTVYEDLKLVLNVLYDDTQVLPDPRQRTGTVLIAGSEVKALESLAGPLTAVLDRLGNAEASAYLESAEWPEVVSRAAVALASMVRRGGCF